MKNIWPIAISVLFVVFIGSLVGFVIWAAGQREDLVSASYYNEEINYQQHLEASARARAEGLIPQIHLDAEGRHVEVRFASAPVVEQGSITLYRPSEAELDQTIVLRPDASGGQRIDASGLKPGLWRVRIAWVAHGALYFSEDSVMVTR